MSYTPNNSAIYLTAEAGVLAGIGSILNIIDPP